NEPTAEERAKYPRIARVVKDVWNYPATHTSMDLPVSRAVVEVVEHATGHGIVQMPTLGGSVPMYIFENLHLPVIGVPTVNYDNNQMYIDRKSTRLNSSHGSISYAVFCLKKKKKKKLKVYNEYENIKKKDKHTQ